MSEMVTDVTCIDCEKSYHKDLKICPHCGFCTECDNERYIVVGNCRSSSDGTQTISCPNCNPDGTYGQDCEPDYTPDECAEAQPQYDKEDLG